MKYRIYDASLSQSNDNQILITNIFRANDKDIYKEL